MLPEACVRAHVCVCVRAHVYVYACVRGHAHVGPCASVGVSGALSADRAVPQTPAAPPSPAMPRASRPSERRERGADGERPSVRALARRPPSRSLVGAAVPIANRGDADALLRCHTPASPSRLPPRLSRQLLPPHPPTLLPGPHGCRAARRACLPVPSRLLFALFVLCFLHPHRGTFSPWFFRKSEREGRKKHMDVRETR